MGAGCRRRAAEISAVDRKRRKGQRLRHGRAGTEQPEIRYVVLQKPVRRRRALIHEIPREDRVYIRHAEPALFKRLRKASAHHLRLRPLKRFHAERIVLAELSEQSAERSVVLFFAADGRNAPDPDAALQLYYTHVKSPFLLLLPLSGRLCRRARHGKN